MHPSTFSRYENYNYISPVSLYARIKLELASYFDAGAVDDLLFPIYTEEALNKFRKSFLKLETACLRICNYSASLPAKFNKVREAWLINPIYATEYAYTSYKETEYEVVSCDDACTTDKFKVKIPNNVATVLPEFYLLDKLSGNVILAYRRHCLLTPGNIHAKQCCDDSSPNLTTTSRNSFDIRDGKFITSFESGDVHLLYYSNQTDDDNNPLIPDDHFVQDYIRKYIKARLFENIHHMSGAETFNQSYEMWNKYEREADLAWASLQSESKKWTVEKSFNKMKQSLRKNDRYRIR